MKIWQAFLAGLIRHAGVLGIGGAVLTLGIWALQDHMASAHHMTRTDTPPPAAPPQVQQKEPAPEINSSAVDPYADADFKVPRAAHRRGKSQNLKEAFLKRSESKAQAWLLQQTRQQANRSQYDCEAAERAAKYLEADLDVWGFSAWQLKYFPTAGYKGASLPKCKNIASLVDPSPALAVNRR